MITQHFALVQQSFEAIRPIAPVAAELFYAKLFDLDPSLRPMFKGDIKRQGELLMTMLGAAVKSLNDLDKLVPVVKQLGARHVGYGVIDTHYATVGNALIYTLEAALGPEFTIEVRDAWLAVYSLLTNVMKQGADEAEMAIAA
ncbi:MAG: globin family protein [Betaproteobacteria bacterium]